MAYVGTDVADFSERNEESLRHVSTIPLLLSPMGTKVGDDSSNPGYFTQPWDPISGEHI